MVQLQARRPPPPDYYRDNFLELAEFVLSHYGSALRPVDLDYVSRFRACSALAQRLLVRLFMRKGPLFRVQGLNYAEVPDTRSAVSELEQAGLISLRPNVAADRVMAMLTRSELVEQFPHVRGRCVRSVSKLDFVNEVLASHSDHQILVRLGHLMDWMSLCSTDVVCRLQLLCFGTLGQDLSAFVLRDLGTQRIERYSLDRGGATDLGQPEVLERYLEISATAQWLSHLHEIPALAESALFRLAKASAHRPSERRRSRLLNELGRWHERHGEFQRALECYVASTRHPARERQVRIYEKLRESGAVEIILSAMRADPWCSEEAVFAERRCKAMTALDPVIRTRTLAVDDLAMTPGAIEAHALRELATAGSWGVHLENRLPLGLAALAYWDVLFMPVSGAFTHLFQHGPHDLFQDDFAIARRAAILGRHAELAASPDPGEVLLQVWDAKYGTASAMLVWKSPTRAMLQRIVKAMPREQLLGLTRAVIENPGRCRTGFPDLFVQHGDGTCEFIEVKGPSDQLQPQQRAWLTRLADLGIPASVLKYTSCRR